MKFKPLEHQEKIISHINEHEKALVFVGMGLGKTSATLKMISDKILNLEARAALIVAPLRVCNLTWSNEIAKWDEFSWMRFANLRTKEGIKAWEQGNADVYVINYEQLMKFSASHLRPMNTGGYPADILVFDELTKAKNPASKRIKSIRPFVRKFKRVIGLTGTPTPNSHLDLFGQVSLVDGGERLGTSFYAFKNRYFRKDYMGYNYTIHDWAREKIEDRISDITITLSSKDWLDIPDVVTKDHYITLNRETRKLVRVLEKELFAVINQQDVVIPNAAVLMGKLLQLNGGSLYDAEGEVIDIHEDKLNMLDNITKSIKAPVLVIYNYKHERDRILDKFPQARVFSEEMLDDWNARKFPMMIANAQSIGHGLNLQGGSSDIIWFSQTWSRELYDQTNARLARQGQDEITVIHRILATDSVDDAVVEALRCKGDNQAGLLESLKNLEKLR